MLNFNFLGFPVRVHWLFWVVSVLLSGQISNPGPEALKLILLWVGVVFVSILWHEIGHAQAWRKFGSRAQILLYGMGGLCSGSGRFTRRQSMWISAAGPAASLSLYLLTLLIAKVGGFTIGLGILGPYISDRGYVAVALQMSLWVNGLWTLINLLPVMPLDGGHLFRDFMATRKPQIVPVVGAIAAGTVAVCALILPPRPMIFLAFFFGYLAYTNWQRGQGTHRGGFW